MARPLWIVRLRGAQRIPAERTARLERDAEADLEAIRRLEHRDQAGLTLGAFGRPLAEPEDTAGILNSLAQRTSQQSRGKVIINDSACSTGSSKRTAVPEDEKPEPNPAAARRQQSRGEKLTTCRVYRLAIYIYI